MRLGIANDVDGAVPTGDTSHRDPLNRMRAARPGLRPASLDDGLYAASTESKGFRHRVGHRYGFDLDAGRIDARHARRRIVFSTVVATIHRPKRFATAKAEDTEPE